MTSVPDDYLNEAKLRRMFGPQVKNLWIASDCAEMEELVKERDKVAYKLEGAETKLVKMANAARIKSLKKGGSQEESVQGPNDVDGESGSAAARWLRPKDRPTHRLKFLIGKKVDTINWCRSELERLIPKVDALQASMRAGEGKFICSVFIEFYSQKEAQAAYQSLAHHQPLHMSPRFIGINPDEVIWKNLKINWASRIVRNLATLAFCAVLVIFWAIPMAFAGAVSNIKNLESISFLSWISKIPTVIIGVVQGLLPGILIAVLMALLPIVLRLAAKWGGMPSLSRIELRVQNSYFFFQVIQVFLVPTLSSGAAAAGKQIADDPSSATSLLASSLPLASNLYISYLIIQGLSISAGMLAAWLGVILLKVLGKLLDKTPRKMYKRWTSLAGLGWGTVFPVYTNLAVIGKFDQTGTMKLSD